MDNNLTQEGERLVKQWKHATDKLAHAKRELNKAECNFTNVKNALGDWLLPDDAEQDEKFCVWYADSLVAAYLPKTTGGNVDPIVTLRSKGKHWDEL